MGSSTVFTGELNFMKSVNHNGINALRKVLGEDCREHPEWNEHGAEGLTYVDLRLTDALDGLRWDGSEKTYDLIDKVNLVTSLMHAWGFKDFSLRGSLEAQGDTPKDHWYLDMVELVPGEANVAVERPKKPKPHKTVGPAENGHYSVNTGAKYEYKAEHHSNEEKLVRAAIAWNKDGWRLVSVAGNNSIISPGYVGFYERVIE